MSKAAVAEKPKAGSAAKPGAGPANAGAAADEPVGMEKAELKRVLKFAQQAPVRIAFALGADGKAIVLMDRRKPPRALEKELKEAAPDSKNHRFGTAAVGAGDPKLVRLTVNKSAPGMGRRLVVAFKGTGFSKVEVGTEDGGPPETAEDEEPDEGKEGAQSKPGNGPTPVGKGAEGQGNGQGTGKGDGARPAQPAPAQAGGEPSPVGRDAAGAKSDTGELVAKLTPKVRQMLEVAGKHPEQKAPLQKLATAAQASLRGAMLTLKPEDLDKASADIDRFCKAVDEAAKAPAMLGGGLLAGSGLSDLKGIGAAVTELAKRGTLLVQSNPALKEVLQKHLTHVKAALTGGDLAKAAQHKDALERALGEASEGHGAGSRGTPPNGAAGDPAQAGKREGEQAQPAAPAAQEGTAARGEDWGEDWGRKRANYGKAAEIWAKTVAKVESDLHQIRKDLLDAFGGDEHGKAMEKELVGEIEGCLDALDLSLHKVLDGLSKMDGKADAGQAAQGAVEEARQLVDRHLEHLESDHFMQHVDDNPSGIKVREVLSHSLGRIHDVLKA